MWAFRFGAVYIHSHINQSHQSQFKKMILSETPCTSLLYTASFKEFGSLVCLWHDVKLRKTQLEVRLM